MATTNSTVDIAHWQTEEDIPKHIKEFIINTSNKRVIYEESTDLFYCAKCVNPLDENAYCPNCNIHHKKYDFKNDEVIAPKDITIIDKINPPSNFYFSKNYLLNTICNYFVFDIIDNDVYLYFLEEEVSYDSPVYINPFKTSNISIDLSKSYLISQKGLTNLKTKTYIPFLFLDKCNQELEEKLDIFYKKLAESKEYKEAEKILLDFYDSYLYTDNLMDLQSTIYKYSKIWELTEYLKEEVGYFLASLTLNPLHYPQFEYLVNYKLYNLAWYSPSSFKKGTTFQEIFGVEKKYLSFMVEHNICWNELALLQVYPTTDMEIIQFFNGWLQSIKDLVVSYKLDLKVLMNYLLKMNLTQENIIDYLDYINMAKEVGLDLKEKKVLYPHNLREAHDELFNQIKVIEDPIVDEKIDSLAKALSINKYEDDKYVIYPASSIADLVEESRQQKNCVRTYCDRIANNKCHIYFMREKQDISKSFVTIEVCNNKVVQARVKYNELPSDEIKQILKKWEDKLVFISLLK